MGRWRSGWWMAQVNSGMLAAAWLLSAMVAGAPGARAQHACDAIGDEGWRVAASNEVTGVKDGAPYRDGGDWVVDRITTLLPLCNYFNAVGNYSLRSYALDPFERKERVVLCRAGTAVPPYAGPCPPQ
jgi:hypothetical protein